MKFKYTSFYVLAAAFGLGTSVSAQEEKRSDFVCVCDAPEVKSNPFFGLTYFADQTSPNATSILEVKEVASFFDKFTSTLSELNSTMLAEMTPRFECVRRCLLKIDGINNRTKNKLNELFYLINQKTKEEIQRRGEKTLEEPQKQDDDTFLKRFY